MKRIVSLAIVLSLLFTGCASNIVTTSDVGLSSTDSNTNVVSSETTINQSNVVGLTDSNYLAEEVDDLDLSSMSDPELLTYMEGAVYEQLIDEIGDDGVVENVSAVYISQEYIDELTYNSQANIFFGYTLQELNEQFQGQKYVFTVENGQTVVQPMPEYDDTYYQIVRNVAVGSGVIILCVTVSALTAGAAPAASMIFAMSAQSGTLMALSSGVISGVSAGLSTGLSTGNWDQAFSAGALAASEGFMWGAIGGAILGGAGEAIGLHGAANPNLTMDQVAIIQRETKMPLSLIGEFQSWEQYEIIRESGLYGRTVNGAQAIIRDIDLNYVDELGRTNLERMQQGLAALDPETGLAYELHHMGQTQDATIAILTQAEHRGVGNHAIWHDLISESVVDHGTAWAAQREAFWRSLAALLG